MIDLVDLNVLQSLSYLIGALGVVVGVAYYVVSVRDTRRNMRANLETRQAQLLIQLFSHYNTREFLEDYFEVIGTDYENLRDWMTKYGFSRKGGRSIYPAWIRVGRYFDGTGLMVRKGLINLELADELLRELVMNSWEAMSTWVIENRKSTRNDDIWRNFEFLYNEIKRTRPDNITHEEMIRVGRMLLND